MYRGLNRYLAVALLVSLIVAITIAPASGEIEKRLEVRSGDLQLNVETIFLAPNQTIFHTDTATTSDSSSLAISFPQALPFSTAGGSSVAASTGPAITQTSDQALISSSTGFFSSNWPYSDFVNNAGEEIGGNIGAGHPVRISRLAGVPAGTMMVFPSMVEITRVSGDSGQNPGYSVNTKNLAPYYPGNMMNITTSNKSGVNKTVLQAAHQSYMDYGAPKQEIANKTVMERMWVAAHLNFNLDKMYVGETCSPVLIAPMEPTFGTMNYGVNHTTVIRTALSLTRPGKHIKRVFWDI